MLDEFALDSEGPRAYAGLPQFEQNFAPTASVVPQLAHWLVFTGSDRLSAALDSSRNVRTPLPI
jgi:hypothetical protein